MLLVLEFFIHNFTVISDNSISLNSSGYFVFITYMIHVSNFIVYTEIRFAIV